MASARAKPKYIYDLPYLPQRNLALILDDNNQWKELGSLMQYNVTRLNEFGRTHSPTITMFADWGQKNHSIAELFVLLSNMQHYRALEILMPFVDEELHVLYRNGELNLAKLLKPEAKVQSTGATTPVGIQSGESQSPRPQGSSLPKSYDSCNFNVPGNERAFPSKLVELAQPQVASRPIPMNQADVSRSENIQASWSTPSPGALPIPSPRHGPINGAVRRDSESSAFSDASSASAMSNIPPIDESELMVATNHWNAASVLGKGGFGTVYKGTWKNTLVAIKRMENKGLAGTNVIPMQQSLGELRILNAVRHDNILPLYGYSLGGDYPCLVYQFMPNGSLEDRLLCRQNTYPLNWEYRFNIARGTARGLQFLHTTGDKPLIHGDIKSANILLDKNYEPKIGDFGLAREGPQTHYTHIKVSRVLGTRPYLPDEYLRGKKISTKVDTYSFGIVLFEIGTGLRAYDSHRKYPYLKEEIENSGHIDLRDVKAGQTCVALYQPLMHLGRMCTATRAKERPEMVQVLQTLDQLATESELYIRQGAARVTPSVLTTPPEPSPVRVEPRDKEVPFFPRTTRDKEVPFLPPTLMAQHKTSPEPTSVVARAKTPVVESPALLPSIIPPVSEPDNLPALDQLVISAGVCDVMSGDIPRLDSLLNAEPSCPATDKQDSSSSSSSSSYDSSTSSNESESRLHTSKTAQKEIPFFGPK